MTDKKSKFSQIEKDIFYSLVAFWVLCAVLINTFDVAKFIPLDTQTGYIAEKVEIIHIQRRNEWILLPAKAKNIIPRFICYYFKDNFCEKVQNYQFASDVHYLKFDDGTNYIKGNVAGDFNALMTKATIYTNDNRVMNYHLMN